MVSSTTRSEYPISASFTATPPPFWDPAACKRAAATYIERARELSGHHKIEQAIGYAERAHSCFPSQETHESLAQLHALKSTDEGDGEAIRWLESCPSPLSRLTCLTLCSLYLRQKRSLQAEALADRLLEEFFEAGSGSLYKALACSQRQAYEEALNPLNRHLSETPRHSACLHARASAFEALGRYVEAAADWEALFAINGQMEDLQSAAQAHAMAGSLERALGSYAQLAETSKLCPAAWEAVERLCDRMLADDPKREEARLWRGKSLFKRGYYDQAIGDFRLLPRTEGNATLSALYEAASLYRIGLRKEAAALYGASGALHTSFPFIVRPLHSASETAAVIRLVVDEVRLFRRREEAPPQLAPDRIGAALPQPYCDDKGLHFCFVAQRPQSPSLIAMVHYRIDRSSQRCKIAALAVARKYRRKQIGSLLLQQALQNARSQGSCVVHLKSTKEALPFYQAHGFRLVHDRTMELNL